MVNVFDARTGELNTERAKLVVCSGWVPYFTLSGKYIGHKAGDKYKLANGMVVNSYWSLYKIHWSLRNLKMQEVNK